MRGLGGPRMTVCLRLLAGFQPGDFRLGRRQLGGHVGVADQHGAKPHKVSPYDAQRRDQHSHV